MNDMDEVMGTPTTELMSQCLDSRFEIFSDSNGCCFLAVYLLPEREPVTVDVVIDALIEKNVTNFSYELLQQVVSEASGVPVNITEPPPLADPDIQILISNDRMEAFVSIANANEARVPTVDELIKQLDVIGVRHGIDQDKLLQVCLTPSSTIPVAAGKLPIPGQNAHIYYLFDTENRIKLIEAADGRVDYKNINLITTVHTGAILAKKIPATTGENGIDVFGNLVLPKPGRDIALPLGSNVITDGTNIIAAIAGQAVCLNERIHVLPVLKIDGDVDYSSGNIDFVGNVIIGGSIQSGFSVKATGDIEIQGTICGGFVEGKNINIHMGIQGMMRGYVKAAASVYAKFIEHAHVSAGDSIFVNDSILHSQIDAQRKIVVRGYRSLIAGGKVTAGEEIRAKSVGTQVAITTVLEVGVNPQLREEYKQLQNELRKIELNLSEIKKSLIVLRSIDPESLTDKKRELLLQLTKAQFQLTGQLDGMQKRFSQIGLELERLRLGKVCVEGTIHSGVKVVVGNQTKLIREPLRFSTLYLVADEVTVSAYY